MPHAWTTTVEQLWQGSLLASIAHAIAVARFPTTANEQSWDGLNYSVQDSMGSRGTICFAVGKDGKPVRCGGAFFANKSPRRKLTDGWPQDPFTHFDGCNEPELGLVREAFLYLLESFHGEGRPWVTSGFWTDAGRLVSQDDEAEFLQHSGRLLERQLLPIEAAVGQWSAAFSLSGVETDMLRALYHKKVTKPTKWVVLTPDQLALVREHRQAGVDASWELFAQIKIRFQPK
jgi:hypothetical protein